MSNSFCLFLGFWINFWPFCDQLRSESLRQINLTYPENIEQGHFISGLWRGFHESQGFTVYYGYQFRPDGSFLARHRIYQKTTIIEDITWQGQWQFTGDILQLNAVNLKDKTQLLTLEFQLTEIFKLVYLTGSLSDAYQMMILNKVGQ